MTSNQPNKVSSENISDAEDQNTKLVNYKLKIMEEDILKHDKKIQMLNQEYIEMNNIVESLQEKLQCVKALVDIKQKDMTEIIELCETTTKSVWDMRQEIEKEFNSLTADKQTNENDIKMQIAIDDLTKEEFQYRGFINALNRYIAQCDFEIDHMKQLKSQDNHKLNN